MAKQRAAKKSQASTAIKDNEPPAWIAPIMALVGGMAYRNPDPFMYSVPPQTPRPFATVGHQTRAIQDSSPLVLGSSPASPRKRATDDSLPYPDIEAWLQGLDDDPVRQLRGIYYQQFSTSLKEQGMYDSIYQVEYLALPCDQSNCVSQNFEE